MKKRILGLLLTIGVIVNSLNCVTFAEDVIRVYVDDQEVVFDVLPQIIDGRTMVPMRKIFESLGATVEWDGDTKTVSAYNEDYFVTAKIDSTKLYVNSVEKTMDIAPMIIDGRTLVPARFIAEAFECDVQWDGNNRVVYIITVYPEITAEDSAGCYLDSLIPDYSDVTGIPLKRTFTLDSGSIVYVYDYRSVDDIGAYWKYLIENGWCSVKKDGLSNFSVLEAPYINYDNFSYVLSYIQFDFDEVWIVPSTK